MKKKKRRAMGMRLIQEKMENKRVTEMGAWAATKAKVTRTSPKISFD